MDAVVGPLILHHRIQPIVLHLAAPQPIVLPCAAPKGHGKETLLPSVFCGSRQNNNFFSLLTLKLFLFFTYNMWYSMLKFGIFLYLFVIFN